MAIRRRIRPMSRFTNPESCERIIDAYSFPQAEVGGCTYPQFYTKLLTLPEDDRI
jgi:hypothetical protein